MPGRHHHPPQMGQPQMGQPQMGQPQLGPFQKGPPQMGPPQMGPPQMGPPQYLANSNLQPANPPSLPHYLLPSTPVNLFPSPLVFRPPPGILYPVTARAPPYPATVSAPPYPGPATASASHYSTSARVPHYSTAAGAPPYPPTSRAHSYPATARAHLHTVPMSLAGNPVPYSRSNSYPIQQTAGMVSPQQYPNVLPYSVGKSPPYRQMSGRQDQPALLPYPPMINPSHPPTSSIADSQIYGAGHNAPTSYIPSNPGLPSRNTSASLPATGSRQPHDSQHGQRRPHGKRNRRKTTQQGNN